MSVQKSLAKMSSGSVSMMDKSVDNFVKNDTYINILRVLLIAYVLLIRYVPDAVLQLFDYFLFRLLVSGITAYFLFKDVVSALLMALAFILSVQEARRRQQTTTSHQGINTQTINKFMKSLNAPDTLAGYKNNSAPQGASPNPVMTQSEIATGDPAFKTMTQNLNEKVFTTDTQFTDAQSNLIQGTDPDMGIKTFVNQGGAQGMDVPTGFDTEASQSSAF